MQTRRWVLSAHTGSTPSLHGEGLPISMRHGSLPWLCSCVAIHSHSGLRLPPTPLPPLSIFLCLPWQLLAYHLSGESMFIGLF